jgi:hypothetical protein
MSFKLTEKQLAKRWKVLITKNVNSYDSGYSLKSGDIIENCYVLKACDGLWVNVNNFAVNIPLDCFEIIKGE